MGGTCNLLGIENRKSIQNGKFLFEKNHTAMMYGKHSEHIKNSLVLDCFYSIFINMETK